MAELSESNPQVSLAMEEDEESPACWSNNPYNEIEGGAATALPGQNVSSRAAATAKPQSTLTLSDQARASNPGGVSVDCLRWTRFKPKWPIIFSFALLAVGILAIVMGNAFYCALAIVPLIMLFLYFKRISEHFRHGDANPGIVVSLRPTLIAVPTDLTKGLGSCEVIKIVKIRLRESAGEPLKVGSCVPTVALYRSTGNALDPFWEDFFPVPVDYVTGDTTTIRNLVSTFPSSQFRKVEAGLKAVAKPYRPGLYKLRKV